MSDKTAAILGVGPGLGAAIARRFAREDFAVALMARREAGVADVRREIKDAGGTALPPSTDATDPDPDSVTSAFERARTELGDPGVFVYNAGAFQMGGILELSPEKFDECFKANCAGAFYAAQHALPAMIEGGSGTVLLTGATASAARCSARRRRRRPPRAASSSILRCATATRRPASIAGTASPRRASGAAITGARTARFTTRTATARRFRSLIEN